MMDLQSFVASCLLFIFMWAMSMVARQEVGILKLEKEREKWFKISFNGKSIMVSAQTHEELVAFIVIFFKKEYKDYIVEAIMDDAKPQY